MLDTINLSQIDSGGVIDSRKTGREDAINGLAASIDAHGLLLPILVRPTGGVPRRFEVVAGNRRLAALRLVAQKNGIAEDRFPVACNILDCDDAAAFEASLAENVVRLPPHPIDQYEAFAGVQVDHPDWTAADIAARFGLTSRAVEQTLALGGLHPDIRAAWRSGEIDAASAKAFTLARGDLEKQKEVFDRLSRVGQLYASHILAAISGRMPGGGRVDISGALTAVGADVYREAGGAIIEDLFGDQTVVSDEALLEELLSARLAAVCDELVREGWAWALPRSGVSNHWSWPRTFPKKKKGTPEQEARAEEVRVRMRDISSADDLTDDESEEYDALDVELDKIQRDIEKRSYSDKAKKGLGCFVWLDHNGAIDMSFGHQRPEEARAAARAQEHGDDDDGDGQSQREREAPKAGPKISAALNESLSIQMSRAAGMALAENPVAAIAAAYAAVAAMSGIWPVSIRLFCAQGMREAIDAEPDDLFQQAIEAGAEGAMALLAGQIGTAVNLHQQNSRPRTDWESRLLSKIDPEALRRRALEVFDAEDFFTRAPLAVVTEALAEMGEPKPKGKKPDVVAAAVAAQKKHGWLPAEMRGPGDE